MRPLKSSFPKLPFRDGLCGWCLLVGGCQLFRAWVLIKGIKERQGAILRDSLLGGWVFIFSDFHWRREGGGTEFCCKNMMRNPQLPSPNSPLFYLFIYLFIYVFSHTLHCRFIQVLYMLIFGSKLYSLAFVHVYLPACRRLLFPLLHAEKGRLRNAVANRVPASRWVPKILGTRCDRLTHSAHCLT